jgi:tetratricopeptide (TPR) repeat protein
MDKTKLEMDSKLPDELWAQVLKDSGNHYVRHQEYKKARSNYQKSLERHPEKLDSAYRLAAVQTLDGKLDEALKNLKKKSVLGEILTTEKCWKKIQFNKFLLELICVEH